MTAVPVILILFLISGIACAWFAGLRHRNQAGWFLFGCLTGPLAVLILLLLPPLPESKSKTAVARVVAGVLIMFIVAAAVVMGGAEFWERYQEGERYAELDNWALYGDALIRLTRSTEHPSDAIVIKSAKSQIDEYQGRLREGMCWTMDDLDSAVKGVRYSTGARGVLEYASRLVTFRSPQWPAPLPMTPREQQARIADLTKRMSQYEEYLNQIQAVRADTTATMSTN